MKCLVSPALRRQCHGLAVIGRGPFNIGCHRRYVVRQIHYTTVTSGVMTFQSSTTAITTVDDADDSEIIADDTRRIIPPMPSVPLSPSPSPSSSSTSSRTSSSSPQSSPSSSSSSSPRALMFFASEVGTLIGLNPYADMTETFDKLLWRSAPTLVETALSEIKATTGRDIVSRTEQLEAAQSGQLKAALNTHINQLSAYSPAQVASARSELLKLIDETVDPAMRDDVVQHVQSQLYSSYGAINETVAIKSITSALDTHITDNNRTFYSQTFGMITPIQPANHTTSTSMPSSPRYWAVGGRIDGFMNGRLIEIKNRIKSFKSPLPLYERAQLEAYMAILDISQCELIEYIRANNNDNDDDQDVTDHTITAKKRTTRTSKTASLLPRHRRTLIVRDERVWREFILPRLHRFACFLDDFVHDQHKLVEYLMADSDTGKLKMIEPIVPSRHTFVHNRIRQQTGRSKKKVNVKLAMNAQ